MHLIKLWPVYWVKQMGKTNQSVGDNNPLDKSGGRKLPVCHFTRTSSGNALGAFYWQLPIGLKDARYGENLNNLSIRRGELHFKVHYTDMFVGRYIY